MACFFMLSWSQSVNKVVVKIHLPSLLLLFQLADSEVLATTFQTPPSLPANITKCRPAWAACMLVSLSSCLSIHKTAHSLIHYLPPLFLFLSVACLSSPTGFLNVKCQQRGRQRGRCTFLMEGFYIFTSLPSLFLHLVHWGEEDETDGGEKL